MTWAGPMPPNPTRRPVIRAVVIGGLTGVGFLLAAAGLAFVFGAELGLKATLVGMAAAVIPLCIVVPTYLWLDRFESEPVRLKIFAFGWGALVAPAVALVFNTGSMIALQQAGVADSDTLAAVLVAPLTEESIKGLGVLLIFWFARREVDGVVDGLVYAGLVAAGFAFSENVLYLGRAVLDPTEGALAGVFILRGLFGPFAHPLFTSFIGVGIGLAVLSRSVWARVGWIVGGWTCAVLLHALWNLSATSGIAGYLVVYLLVQVPLFAAYVWLIVWSRRREGALIARHLLPYADLGWLTYVEVSMLASLSARRAARSWARSHGGRAAQQSMEAFHDAASELALLRDRMARGHLDPGIRADEVVLLHAITAHRRDVIGSPVA